jgi:deoxyhypusine synthase
MKYEIKDEKKELLSEPIQHIDIKAFNAISLIEAFDHMAFQSRNLANACKIYDTMLADTECSVILCLAGSLVSAGLKNVIVDMIRHNMVDAIVSTGAIVVDQDFFEGLGFKHYRGEVRVDDTKLQKMHIDRIYDTFIDEDDLRICDMTTKKIADEIPPRPYSSREFIYEMGRYLEKHGKNPDSFVLEAYKHEIPIFCPAFSDSSAGFGLVFHQHERKNNYVTIDSVKDFRELTELKVQSKQTGLLMIGGGVPKNFVQDTVVAADILGIDAPMHKYSWGKVDTGYEQMVYSEATITFPLVVSYAYHKGAWKKRKQQKLNQLFK